MKIEKRPCYILNKNWPNPEEIGTIIRLSSSEIESKKSIVDILNEAHFRQIRWNIRNAYCAESIEFVENAIEEAKNRTAYEIACLRELLVDLILEKQ